MPTRAIPSIWALGSPKGRHLVEMTAAIVVEPLVWRTVIARNDIQIASPFQGTAIGGIAGAVQWGLTSRAVRKLVSLWIGVAFVVNFPVRSIGKEDAAIPIAAHISQ